MPTLLLAVDVLMVADIHENDFLFSNEELDGNAVGEVDGNRVALEAACLEGVQAEGRVMRIKFEEGKALRVLILNLGMLVQKASGLFFVRFREDQFIHR